MSAPTNWWQLDATAQAALVRSGQTTPEELVELALDRIARLNPHINAVVTTLPDEARQLAATLPDHGQPFRGVPILLKDAGEELEGTPLYMGSALLRDIDYRSTRTTELVRRLLAAGFIPVGKTNVPEFSYGFSTEPVAFGPTRNPWNLERSAGGSSGGSAAAVAAGLTAIAQGSDANGSIRVPAACCGLVTLRPSLGLVPTQGPRDLPEPSPTWTAFVLARTVRDLTGTLDAVANPRVATDLADPGVATDLAEPPAGLPVNGLRIGLLDHDPGPPYPVRPAVSAAVHRVGQLLAAHGHNVTESHPAALDGLWSGMSALAHAAGDQMAIAGYRWIEQTIGRPPRDDEVEVPEVHLRGRHLTPPTQAAVDRDVRNVFERLGRLNEWWERHDILVMPAQRQPAWPLGNGWDWDLVGLSPMQFCHYGHPSLVLPIDWTPDGLPVAVQLTAHPRADRQLLALAAHLEADNPWSHRWPPLAESAV